MIEDLFFKRYQHEMFYAHRDSGGPHPSMQRILSQAAMIFAGDVVKQLRLDDAFFVSVQEKLVRELGSWPFPVGGSAMEIFDNFLNERYDLLRHSRHGSVDSFIKARLSLIELLFRDAENYVRAQRERAELRASSLVGKDLYRKVMGIPLLDQPTRDKLFEEKKEVLSSATSELNIRFRASNIGLHYHNGLIQLTDDNISQDHIVAPFWSVTGDQKWRNVDEDMRRAVDLADTGGHDPALYAAMALESTIKIISDEKGWTRANQSGAAAYIDNLVSQNNGRFIDVWEAEALKAFFSKIRNPHGHGPGSAPQPSLTDHQTRWAIEACMSWIKSLIRRL